MNPERLRLGVSALKRLSPHPGRFAYYKPTIRKYQMSKPGEGPTDAIFARHIVGEVLIGAVSGDQDGKTTSVGIDLDQKVSKTDQKLRDDQNPRECAKAFIATAQAWDVPILVHSSKSGKGIHIRTLFSEAVPQFMARAFYLYLAAAARIDQDKAFDKVWPPVEGQGILAMPLQLQWIRNTGGTLALDPATLKPYDLNCQIEAILESRSLSYKELCEIMYAMEIRTERMARSIAGQSIVKKSTEVREGTDGGLAHMVKHCEAVERLGRDAANINYEFWFAMMTNFKPFIGGKEVFEAYCKMDASRFEQKEFDRSWKAINGGPRKCVNLDPTWQCPHISVCGARAPAALPFCLHRMGKLRV